MLSRKINVALGIGAIALTGVAAATVAGFGDEDPQDAVTSTSSRIEAEPSAAPTSEPGIWNCEKNQAISVLSSEIDPTYLTGKESPRTPQAAIESSNKYVTGKFAEERADLTYEPFGEVIKEGDNGYRHEAYVARRSDGRIRAFYSVAGGIPGGGWAVEKFKQCSDIPAGLKPTPPGENPKD